MNKATRRRFVSTAIAGLAGTSGFLSGCEKPESPTSRAARVARSSERIAGYTGRIIEKGDAAYDAWRKAMVWQMRKPDRFPDMILRPGCEQDVAAALRFARTSGQRLSVRSGGHNIWGASLRDGGLLVDMTDFKQAKVSAGRGIARFGPSLWARDIMEHLDEHDYAFPVAHCATVPLGGYLLGGGLGLNGDQWGGIACACLTGGVMVLASGEAVRISEKENPDLLWAMQGGGGALPGIVTELEIRTYARPAAVFSATYVFPLPEIDNALGLLQDMVAMEPANTELLALMLHNPQANADAPPEQKKAIAVRAQVYANTGADAAIVLDAIAALPNAAKSAFSMPSIRDSFESLFVESMDWRRGFGFGRFAVENAWTNDMLAAVKAIVDDFAHAPSWKSHIVIQPKLTVPTADSAFSIAGKTYIGIYSVWDNDDGDAESIAWLRRISATLDQHAAGHYINEIDAATNPERLEKCYSADAWKKLRSIRKSWDPDGVLHDFPGLS